MYFYTSDNNCETPFRFIDLQYSLFHFAQKIFDFSTFLPIGFEKEIGNIEIRGEKGTGGSRGIPLATPTASLSIKIEIKMSRD